MRSQKNLKGCGAHDTKKNVKEGGKTGGSWVAITAVAIFSVFTEFSCQNSSSGGGERRIFRHFLLKILRPRGEMRPLRFFNYMCYKKTHLHKLVHR